jgi:hypothetical protein
MPARQTVHDIDARADALVRLSRLVTDDAGRIHDALF